MTQAGRESQNFRKIYEVETLGQFSMKMVDMQAIAPSFSCALPSGNRLARRDKAGSNAAAEVAGVGRGTGKSG